MNTTWRGKRSSVARTGRNIYSRGAAHTNWSDRQYLDSPGGMAGGGLRLLRLSRNVIRNKLKTVQKCDIGETPSHRCRRIMVCVMIARRRLIRSLAVAALLPLGRGSSAAEPLHAPTGKVILTISG